ncbi:MAG: glycosyltransferase family 2 protein [Actinomycetota bacterium]|nr:glycosyltransferase family 2 protein [Actinomycetota bacterium]
MSRSRDGISRRIAVVPAYNEEPTVAGVLDKLAPLVDLLVIVDDGSTDGTRAEVRHWLADHDDAELLCIDQNQGMSAAYHLAFSELRRRLGEGSLAADDLVCTVDADGQHDLDALDAMVETVRKQRLDALLAQRDLGDYPRYKQIGNRVMSVWATLWAGMPLPDVESGYRVFRLGALAEALEYYRGFRYSETVEVAVVLPRLGYRVRNDFSVRVPVFRSRTSMVDAAIDLSVMPAAWWRVMRHRSRLVGYGVPVAATAGLVVAAFAGKSALRPPAALGHGR